MFYRPCRLFSPTYPDTHNGFFDFFSLTKRRVEIEPDDSSVFISPNEDSRLSWSALVHLFQSLRGDKLLTVLIAELFP